MTYEEACNVLKFDPELGLARNKARAQFKLDHLLPRQPLRVKCALRTLTK